MHIHILSLTLTFSLSLSFPLSLMLSLSLSLSPLPLLRAVCQRGGLQIRARELDLTVAHPLASEDILDIFPVTKGTIFQCKEGLEMLVAGKYPDKSALHIHKRALHIHKRRQNIRKSKMISTCNHSDKSAQHICERALYIHTTTEPYTSAREPYISITEL